jgi:hypothetical protein
MYLHIGKNQMIKLKDIISIINLNFKKTESKQIKKTKRGTKNSRYVKGILKKLSQNGDEIALYESIDSDCNSLIVTNHGCYYSPISSKTLLERSKRLYIG